MINVAICDDEKYFADELFARVQRFFRDKRIDCRISEHLSGARLAERTAGCDLIFLDVRMDGQDGFETAAQIRGNGFSGCLVFVTVMRDDVYRAFEYGAFDYLVKPLSQVVFERTMQRFLNAYTGDRERIFVAFRNKRTAVKTNDILYCEVIDRKVYMHLFNGDIVEYYGRISELEGELERKPQRAFFKAHRSYIVNLRRVASYSGSEIVLENGERIPLSRSRKNALPKALLDCMDICTG